MRSHIFNENSDLKSAMSVEVRGYRNDRTLKF